MALGLLLGLDLDGVLEVSNSFPLLTHSGEDDDKSAKSAGEIFSSVESGKKKLIGSSTTTSVDAPFVEGGARGRQRDWVLPNNNTWGVF